MARSTIPLCLLFAAIVGCNRPAAAPEPTYQGRPQSQWVGLLSDVNADTRMQAVRAVSALAARDASLVGRLRPLMNDPDSNVRALAALAVWANTKDKATTVPVLLKLL